MALFFAIYVNSISSGNYNKWHVSSYSMTDAKDALGEKDHRRGVKRSRSVSSTPRAF